jgi:peptide/nickel transport system substrate-binding protein
MPRRLLILLTAMAALLAACGPMPGAPATTPAATAETTLRVVTPFLSQPLDPAKGGGFNAIQFGVGETLMRLDPQFTPKPWLAERLEALDETTWQITLRPGATFHDGAAVDAAAVKASLDRAIARIPTAKTLLDARAIEVRDPRTLVIATNAPNPRMPGLLTEPSTLIVNAAAAAAQGDDAFAQRPIMTGIYQIESFAQDRELALARYPGHWDGAAQAARVIISAQADASARMLALQSGQVDIAIDMRPESVQVARSDPRLRVVSAAPVATMFLYINQTKPIWQDLRVRQALAHAMPPRDALVQTVLRDEGAPGVGPFPPTVLPCPELRGQSHDPARARALLAEAGLRDTDGDGLVEHDGRPLVMTLLSYPQRPALTPMAEIIQANLKDVGIGVEIQSVEQINDALAQQDWDGSMYFNNMAATGDPFGSLAQFYRADGESNRGGYRNAEVEAQIDELRSVVEREERLARSCAISQRLLDDVAIIPLVYPNYNYGVSRSVAGFEEAHPYFLYVLHGRITRL